MILLCKFLSYRYLSFLFFSFLFFSFLLVSSHVSSQGFFKVIITMAMAGAVTCFACVIMVLMNQVRRSDGPWAKLGALGEQQEHVQTCQTLHIQFNHSDCVLKNEHFFFIFPMHCFSF